MTTQKHIFNVNVYFKVTVTLLDADHNPVHKYDMAEPNNRKPMQINRRDIEADLYRRNLACAIVTIMVSDTYSGWEPLENRVFYTPDTVEQKINPIKQPFSMTREDYNRTFPYPRPEFV